VILTLTVLNGPHLGHSAAIHAGAPRTFGRGAGSDVVVQDHYLSDVHFALYCDADGARVRDLQSHHGTFLNEVNVQDAVLRHGDRLRAGQTWFEVALATDGPAADAPASADGLTLAALGAGLRREASDCARWALTAEASPLYAVVDVADREALLELLNDSGDAFRAFDETRAPDALGETAPVLVALTPSTASFAALVEQAWGEGRAIFLTSRATFDELYEHLLLQMDFDDAGDLLVPGWYAPAELAELLRGLTSEAVREFFGPVEAFFAETSDARVLAKSAHADGALRVERIALALPPDDDLT
jgi:hypothetical protein